MFNASILELQSQIQYHQQQQELAEQELDRLKMTQAFAEEVANKVEEALKHIDPKYLDVFREHLLSLFPTQTPVYLEESVEDDDLEYMDEDHPDYRSIEQLQQEDPDTVVAVFHSEQYLKSQGIEPECTNEVQEEYPISHHNPFKPIPLSEYQEGDRPVNMVEISPDIIYVPVDKTAYVAMRAKGRARSYGDYLTRLLTVGSKYVVSDKLTKISDSKYELRIFDISFEDVKHLAKFKLHRDYDHPDNREVSEVWDTTRKREVPPAYTPSPKLTPLNELKVGEIVSLGSNSKQYKVLGTQQLQGTLHVKVVCTYNSEMPALVNQLSYLKQVYRVLKDDVQYSSDFVEDEELDFPTPPYKPIPLDRVELCDIVTTSANSQSAYEVTANLGDHLLATCIYHNSLKHREGQKDFWITEAFLVEKASISNVRAA